MMNAEAHETLPLGLYKLLKKCISDKIETPVFVTHLEQVKKNLDFFCHTFGFTPDEVYYPVKVNFEPQILLLLHSLGCQFEIATYQEAEKLNQLGIPASKMLLGHPVCPFDQMQKLYRLGVRQMVIDSPQAIIKIAKLGRDVDVLMRLQVSNKGSEWSLADKFGVPEIDIYYLLEKGMDFGLKMHGYSFHVGWNNQNPETWVKALQHASTYFPFIDGNGYEKIILNVGGGWPAHMVQQKEIAANLAQAILPQFESFRKNGVKIIAEPGSFLVANCRALLMQVNEIHYRGLNKWVYMNTGIQQGFHWIMGGLKYNIFMPEAEPYATAARFIITGASQDSHDIFDDRCMLPSNLKSGDYLAVFPAGAYNYTSGSYGGLSMPPDIIL